MSVKVINPTPKWMLVGYHPQQAYLLRVCGTVYLVYAWSLESALDECIDYIAEHLPALLCNEMVEEAYMEALGEGMSEEDAHQEASTDTYCGGNHGDYIHSDEWHIVCEGATPSDISRIHHNR